jgi:ATP-binding protein involved in chromosome partitioning
MAYYENNGQRDYIFGKDGGKVLAEQLEVEFIGEIPLLTSIREGADNGQPVASEGSDVEISTFETIARQLDDMVLR